MDTQLDHIAIKVSSIDAVMTPLAALGFTWKRREVFPEVGLEIAFLELSGVTVELLEVKDSSSPVARDPDGLHHVAISRRDIMAAYEAMRADPRYQITVPLRMGGHGQQVFFFRVCGTETVFELVGS